MAKNPHRPGTSASNSFSYDQARLMVQLIKALMRGDDVRIILRSRELGQVLAKFQRMKAKMEAQRAKEGTDGTATD